MLSPSIVTWQAAMLGTGRRCARVLRPPALGRARLRSASSRPAPLASRRAAPQVRAVRPAPPTGAARPLLREAGPAARLPAVSPVSLGSPPVGPPRLVRAAGHFR